MVIRGYPEEIRRKPPPPIAPVVEGPPPPDVRYVYYIPQTERIQLDPNVALIALSVVTVIGIIAIMVSKKS